MLFFEPTFLIFLITVKVAITLVNNDMKKLILLASSYFFYGFWDWRFLGLIWLSTIVDYNIGKLIYKTLNKDFKRYLLIISIASNLIILGFFKYYNFFISSLNQIVENPNLFNTLEIILPVGISFYTFQSMAYTIDIYYGRLKPSSSLVDFSNFIAFFPQLVAGPIERAKNLLPQLKNFRGSYHCHISKIVILLFFGYFKKVLLADNIGVLVDGNFTDYEILNSFDILFSLLLFSLQIYFDFSGYSDMAIGLGRMFGFRFPENFNFPFAASSIKDFWRRWHITLSSWFRDYLYIPLGGNRKGSYRTLLNLLIIFITTGFWHGGAWCFLIWGLIHGLFITIERFWLGSVLEKTPRIVGIFYTSVITLVSWVFFREENLTDCLTHLSIMFGGGQDTEINFNFLSSLTQTKPLLLITLAFLFSTGTLNWIYQRVIFHAKRINTPFIKYPSYVINILSALIPILIMILCTIELNLNSYNPFIYFRF